MLKIQILGQVGFGRLLQRDGPKFNDCMWMVPYDDISSNISLCDAQRLQRVRRQSIVCRHFSYSIESGDGVTSAVLMSDERLTYGASYQQCQ
jgi:hypothetical protein